jgi:tetratricopeptide (TPR) repeat protein
LNISLATRRRHGSPLVSDTLHELGVLNMRQQNAAAAMGFLTDALALKVGLPPEQRARLAISEAATLYQLSVLHSAAGRLDMALDLLHQVVALEGATGSSPVSRAASLQQLGRVHLRKGNLAVAEAHFVDAITLYFSVYGRDKAATHLNVAAVRHQLGACYSAQKQYDNAAEQFGLALVAREAAAATHSTHGGLHLEVMHELQALGQVETDRGRYDAAEAHYSRQQALCGTCLGDLSPELLTWVGQQQQQLQLLHTDSCLAKKARAALDGANKKRIDGVVRSWLFALNGLRTVAKKQGNSARAAELKVQAKDIGRRYDLLLQLSSAADDPHDGNKQHAEIAAATDDHDDDDGRTKKRDAEVIHRLSLFRDTVRAAAKRCTASVGISTEEANALAEEANALAWRLEQHIADAEAGGHAASAATVAVAYEFVRTVRDESKKTQEKVSVAALFQACDHFRARLRAIGHTIVDA